MAPTGNVKRSTARGGRSVRAAAAAQEKAAAAAAAAAKEKRARSIRRRSMTFRESSATSSPATSASAPAARTATSRASASSWVRSASSTAAGRAEKPKAKARAAAAAAGAATAADLEKAQARVAALSAALERNGIDSARLDAELAQPEVLPEYVGVVGEQIAAASAALAAQNNALREMAAQLRAQCAARGVVDLEAEPAANHPEEEADEAVALHNLSLNDEELEMI
jgi:hypothetical protein